MKKITGTTQKKSLLESIWESFKEEWRKSNYWAKFTFFFRALWALVVLGIQRSITLLVTVILVIGIVIGIAWWLISGGYNVVLDVTISPIVYVWATAAVCYAYLRYKYPGKDAVIGGQLTKSGWIRSTPMWIAGVVTLLWALYRGLGTIDWELPYLVETIVIIGFSILMFNERAREKLLAVSKHPAFFIAIGIAIINWLIWALDAEFWVSIWNSQAKFWAINVASLAAVYLLFVKDESTKKTNPVALTFSKIIGGIVGLILATCIWDFMAKGVDVRFPSFGTSRSSSSNTRVPLEVARRVVCECESGCRQFEEDGKTPLKNKGIPSKGIKPSDAFGKYQFREMHRKPALDLGFDLNTEEGQEGYFEYLYLREGFGPWDHDEQYGGGRVCREPKLLALGLDPEFTELYPKVEMVTAPTDKFSEGKKIRSGVYFDWGDSEGEFVVRDQKGALAVFRPSKGVIENLPHPSTVLYFRSLGDKPVMVKLRLDRKPLVRM